MGRSRDIKALPYPIYHWTVLGIALTGLLDAIYLAVSHYRVYTDITYSSFCAVSRSLNCDTVSQSPYSIFLGVPVPVWGVIGYALFLGLAIGAGSRGAAPKRIWPTLFGIALVYCLYSLVLAFLSSYYIRSYCLMCILSYAVNLALLFYVWLIRRRFDTTGIWAGLREDMRYFRDRWRRALPLATVFGGVIVCLPLLFPVYWTFTPPDKGAKVATGITPDGHHWIGADDPQLEITEFTDYLCFQCKKMHYYLRQLINRHPDKIRLIHRHYPMDHQFNPIVVKEPFHVGAGKLAMLAEAAGQLDKFWEMNDLLFYGTLNTRYVNIQTYADQLGVDAPRLSAFFRHPMIRARVTRDIRDGMRQNIIGTPSYVIDGVVHAGAIPAGILNRVIEEK